MPNTLNIIKTAVNFTAAAGVSKVVSDIIQNNTTPETTAEAVKVYAGSVVIGSMIADAASDHVDDKIETVALWIATRKNKKTPTK